MKFTDNKRYILTIDEGSDVCLYDSITSYESSDLNVNVVLEAISEGSNYQRLFRLSHHEVNNTSEYMKENGRIIIDTYSDFPTTSQIKYALMSFTIGS